MLYITFLFLLVIVYSCISSSDEKYCLPNGEGLVIVPVLVFLALFSGTLISSAMCVFQFHRCDRDKIMPVYLNEDPLVKFL